MTSDFRPPCYCTPGPRQCDTLGEHCDRGPVTSSAQTPEPTDEQGFPIIDWCDETCDEDCMADHRGEE